MGNEKERQYILKLGRSPEWKRKVAKMSDAQVFAIYKRELAKEEAAAQALKDERRQNSETKDDIPF